MTRLLRFGCIAYLVFAIVCTVLTLTAHPYGNPAYTANSGYIWQIGSIEGGVELYGEPGPFLCTDQGHYEFAPYAHPVDFTKATIANPVSVPPSGMVYIHDSHNPLADILPSLVVDC